MKRNEESLHNLQDSIQRNNFYIIGGSEEKEREEGQEAYLKK